MMGTPIPRAMRQEMAEMPFYKLCARRGDHECADENGRPTSRLTWEHAMIYAGRKVQEIWAIIPLCPWSHLGPGLNKEKNQWIALSRATDKELEKYPRTDWFQKRGYLVEKYGIYGGKGVDIDGISSGKNVDKIGINYIHKLSFGYPQTFPQEGSLKNHEES